MSRYSLRSMRCLPCIVLTAFALGCGKSGNILGSWTMDAPFGVLRVTFKEGGAYSGSMSGPMANGPVTGTYAVKGNALEMNPPSIQLPNGQTVTPPGGQMRMRMTWKDDRTVELYNGKQTFMMTRQ